MDHKLSVIQTVGSVVEVLVSVEWTRPANDCPQACD